MAHSDADRSWSPRQRALQWRRPEPTDPEGGSIVARPSTAVKRSYRLKTSATERGVVDQKSLATAWVELEAVWGQSQPRVGGAVDRIRTRLPLPLVGLDSDNGAEFINQRLERLRSGGRFSVSIFGRFSVSTEDASTTRPPARRPPQDGARMMCVLLTGMQPSWCNSIHHMHRNSSYA